MNDQEKPESQARSFVVTLMSPSGQFLQLVGADTRKPYDVLESLKNFILEYEDKKPTLFRRSLLNGDPSTGDGEVVVTNPLLVVAVNTPVVFGDDDFEDEESDEDESEDDRPDDLRSKAKGNSFRMAETK